MFLFFKQITVLTHFLPVYLVFPMCVMQLSAFQIWMSLKIMNKSFFFFFDYRYLKLKSVTEIQFIIEDNNFCISIRDICFSNTDICISIREILIIKAEIQITLSADILGIYVILKIVYRAILALY